MKDPFNSGTSELHDELNDLWGAIYNGDAQKAKEYTEKVLQQGYSTEVIVKNALLPPMRTLGEQLRDGKIYIPDILMSARAMQGAMYALKPFMAHGQTSILGTVVIGTVAGDFHDIGKNLVAMILQAKGFTVIDLGNDVTAEGFVDAINRFSPEILGISAMLTTTMSEMKTIIELVVKEGLRSQVTIMIGGAPVSESFAREINADIYAETLFEAGEAAEELVKHRISQYSV